MRWKRSAIPVVVCCAVAVLASACGSSGSAKTAAGSSATTSASAAKSTIVIGNIGDYSGALASSIGGGKLALEAWVSSINASGGIDGHPVKVIIKDGAAGPAAALTAAKQLVEGDHVVAIVGEEDPLGDAAWAQYVAGKGIPVVGGLSLDAPFSTNADFFPSGTNNAALNYGTLALAKQNGPKFGILYCAESPACKQDGTIDAAVASSLGMTVAVNLSVSSSATDYTAACQDLINAGVQSFQVAGASAFTTRVSASCKSQGLKAVAVSADGNVTDAWLKVAAVDGSLSSQTNFPYHDSSSPATKAYQDAIAKTVAGLGDSNGPTVSQTWVGAELFKKAVLNAGQPDVTSASIKAGLYMMKGETLGGLAPPLTFVANQPTLVNCYFVLGIKAGQFTAPQGLKTSCAPADAVNKAIQAIS
jgi:branched-chain amino acid transport system substrate-binding protein